MIAVTRALVGHALFVFCLFAPVVVLGGGTAILLDLPTELAALAAIGVFFTWIGARAGQTEVWSDEPRR